MPPFPAEFVHYQRMDVSGTHPTLYWEQSVEDYEMAMAVQGAFRDGQDQAARDAKKQAEREKKQAESLKRAKQKAGG